jgi:predicted NBD/HSP70 family sugar kinase
VQGVGIAAPLSVGGWHALLGIDGERAARWDGVDVAAAVAALTPLRVVALKDTAAACVAELVAGRGRSVTSFAYVFVDTFVGGGLVIDSHLRGGVHGNAGALGSMALGPSADGTPPQLLSRASLMALERQWRDAGLDPTAAADERALQPPWRALTERWLDEAAGALALGVHAAACWLDLDGVIVDGSTGRGLLDALLAALSTALDRLDWEGVVRPPVMAGTIGSDARAIGGALLPLWSAFAPDRELFLKVAD